MEQQCKRRSPNGREMSGITGTNRVAHGTRQERDIRDKEPKPMAYEAVDNTREMQGAEELRDVTMTETAGETTIGTAASND